MTKQSKIFLIDHSNLLMPEVDGFILRTVVQQNTSFNVI